MDDKEKRFVNAPVINYLRETIVGLCTPVFCSYCGAGHFNLTVEMIRSTLERTEDSDSKLHYMEYDVEYQVTCDKCGKNFCVQPFETKGLIKEIK